jgi:hypothetical protein
MNNRLPDFRDRPPILDLLICVFGFTLTDETTSGMVTPEAIQQVFMFIGAIAIAVAG